MATLRTMTMLAVGLLLVSTGAAQTLSQRCAAAVRAELPGEPSVWVVAALGKGDHTELRWETASGRIGTCRMEPDGRISDVEVSGQRQPRGEPVQTPDESSFEPYTVTCESDFGGRSECEIRPSADVVMVEQLGEEDCIEGLTWGLVDGAIWVDQGCRAVFEVSPRRPPLDPSTLAAAARAGSGVPRGRDHPAFLETRAREQCRNLAAARGANVRRILGSRIEGSTVVVLMEAETWSQRQEVTCRYDPATDRAVIAR